MNSTPDHESGSSPAEPPAREWVKPELEVVSMKEAMSGVLPPDPGADASFSYS